MICVSIGRGRHKQTKAEHRHLVESGADLVELRLDYIRREVNLQRLLRDRPCPTIITIRRQQDHGKWEQTEDARLILLRSAIAAGVEYVDLEDDIAHQIPRYGNTKRIISLHNFRETPENLEEIHARLASMDADIVKIATMANHPHDNFRMLNLIKNSKIPTVGICMGEIGTPSRILAGRYGSPFTYATFHAERSLAPGQLSFSQMVNTYRYNEINEETEIFGVIADPIGHSLSPIIHNKCFRESKMNRVYIPFRVPAEHLDQFLKDCPEAGIKGLSVTIPHKESVLSAINNAGDEVWEIGAANTVVFNGSDIQGYNTDYQAAMGSLEKAMGNVSRISGSTALVLGAGGASRAIACGLKERGADVLVSSRRLTQSEALATRLQCKAVDWNDRHTVRPNILVNATPVGMHPNVNETPFDGQFLKSSMVVFDTVYNPEQTLLVKQARETNCHVITGVDMFVRQAATQYRYFTGVEPPVQLMREEVKRQIGPARY